MKKIKIAVAFTCALAMLLTFGSKSLNNTQASNAQKTYASGPITLYNNGEPAI